MTSALIEPETTKIDLQVDADNTSFTGIAIHIWNNNNDDVHPPGSSAAAAASVTAVEDDHEYDPDPLMKNSIAESVDTMD